MSQQPYVDQNLFNISSINFNQREMQSKIRKSTSNFLISSQLLDNEEKDSLTGSSSNMLSISVNKGATINTDIRQSCIHSCMNLSTNNTLMKFSSCVTLPDERSCKCDHQTVKSKDLGVKIGFS